MKTPTPEQISKARIDALLTQTEAGRLVGYTERGWQDAEKGRRTMPASVWMLYRARVEAFCGRGRKALAILIDGA